MRTLRPGHSEEDCPVTTFSQNKRFSSVFADRPIKFKYPTMQPLKCLKPFELTWSLRKQPSNWWMLLHGPHANKAWESCFQKTLWLYNVLPSVRPCPGLSVCTVSLNKSCRFAVVFPMKELVSCETGSPWSGGYRLVLINKDWRDK